MADGDYQLVVTDGSGTEFGCNKFTVSKDPCPYSDENTVWEGSYNVTWDTPFNLLQDDLIKYVNAGTIVRAYVTPTSDEAKGSMTTSWWNSLLTGGERTDIMIPKAMVLECQLTDQSIELLNVQNGFYIVGNGYTVTKVTVGQ